MKNTSYFIAATACVLLVAGCSSGTGNSTANSSQADPNCIALVEEAKERYTQENITDPNNTGLRFLDEAIVGCSSFDALVASSASVQELFPESTTIELFLLSRCTTAEKPEVKQSQVCQESSQNLLNLGQ